MTASTTLMDLVLAGDCPPPPEGLFYRVRVGQEWGSRYLDVELRRPAPLPGWPTRNRLVLRTGPVSTGGPDDIPAVLARSAKSLVEGYLQGQGRDNRERTLLDALGRAAGDYPSAYTYKRKEHRA